MAPPLTLPAGFDSSVLEPGEGWDGSFVPTAGLMSMGSAELLPYLIPSTGGVTMPAVQTVYVVPSAGSTAVDLIP